MEIKEAAKILDQAISQDKYCAGQKTDSKGWEVVIDGIKGEGNPDTLRKNMLNAELPEPDPTHGHSLYQCSPSAYPYQSHHLVPEKQLPDHKVCAWLTDSPRTQDPSYKLKKDTNYDTNGAKNGYFMPFASTTKEWVATTSGDKHTLICYEMMRRTTIQLHQGPHSYTDYGEELDIETDGYKERVEQFLNTISDKAASHVEACKETCQGQKEDGKIPVQPLESLVKQMYLVSELLKALIDSQRIWVSRRAFNYFDLHKDANNNIKHPGTPFI